MKIRVADYIANFLVEHGIHHGFTVIGGGAMHLNDAFGHKAGLKMIYNHHEQASSMAADCYARINNVPALLCVTTGPGGINALNGVCSAYLDSIPMIVVSGQVRYDTSSMYEKKITGANLRSMGDQEFDIVTSVKNMTKYAVTIDKAKDIRYHLEKAYHLATSGRMGPVWLDIPVNIQGEIVDSNNLKPYYNTNEQKKDDKILPSKILAKDIDKVISYIKKSKRPVIYAGYGIRLSGGLKEFQNVIKKLNIPVVTYWDSIDLIETNNDLYCGRAGNMGDRAGNFAIQNSDLVIAIGTRISIRQTGYNYKDWARHAKVVMVDIDKEEFKKHTIHVDYKIHADAKDFFVAFEKYLDNKKITKLWTDKCWNEQCLLWKNKYPVVDKNKYSGLNVNVYAFFDALSKNLKDGSVSIATSGASCVAGHQAYVIKKKTRFINNNVIASMGYGLPASIGAYFANGKKEVIAFEGDGGFMMNMQEIQTIITNKLNIKLFIINNEGYHSLRITQNNLFSNHSHVGIGPESKDLSFPSYEKIANAFGIKYFSIKKNSDLNSGIKKVLSFTGAAMIEVFTDKEQVWEPKSSGRKTKDGKVISPPLEDMAPFLPREELKANMYY
ncbi:MAG: thiamine pyrophosphate-binding protein [Lachnospiraceae bacterium]|nr:thiamine pyrophosphate-binding protein [Lachnospiraceae bacterium]